MFYLNNHGWAKRSLLIPTFEVTISKIKTKTHWETFVLTISSSRHCAAPAQISTLAVAKVATFYQQRLRKIFDPWHDPKETLEKIISGRAPGMFTTNQSYRMTGMLFRSIYSREWQKSTIYDMKEQADFLHSWAKNKRIQAGRSCTTLRSAV